MTVTNKDKTIASIGMIVTIAGSIWGSVLALDTKYASAQELETVRKDVDKLKWSAVHEKALNDYYRLKELSSKFPNDEQLLTDLEKAKHRLTSLEKKLESIR